MMCAANQIPFLISIVVFVVNWYKQLDSPRINRKNKIIHKKHEFVHLTLTPYVNYE